MSFPKAADIRRKAKGEGYIEDYIRDILALIKDDILAAAERRASEAITELPTDFNIPTMNPSDAQRMIYYFVAKRLEELGYIPTYFYKGMNTENQKWWMRTRWFTENDEQARKYMDTYIKSRTEYTEAPGDEEVVTHRRRPTKKPVAKGKGKSNNRAPSAVSDNPDLQSIIYLND